MAVCSCTVITVVDSAALANTAAKRMMALVRANEGRVAICLTGGSTPRRLYELLGTRPFINQVPWDRVHWFIGDERFVAPNDPLNNMTIARNVFLDRCAPSANIHAIVTDAASPDEAARQYERELKSFYGADELDPDKPLFDLTLMGVGPDGHTASLFPNDPAVEETRRWVVGVPAAHVAPFVPRVSLTLPVLGSCREMLFQVSGQDKRSILSRLIAGEDLPAHRARARGETVWLADLAAMPESRISDQARERPCVLIVMGVSGSGKSTVAEMLAARLGWTYKDGDAFHSKSNIEKMRSGHPLTDDDRLPWLRAIAAEIDRACSGNGRAVIACSALKRAYRDILVHGRSDVWFIYLNGSRDLIARRSAMRLDHFMPLDLLDSQFETLELPQADEPVITVSIDAPVETIVEQIIGKLADSANDKGARHRSAP